MSLCTIQEHIWERLEDLFENDEEFRQKISLAAEEDAVERGFFDKNYYNNIVEEYLMQLCDDMVDNFDEYVPYLDDDIVEYAYLIAKIEE